MSGRRLSEIVSRMVPPDDLVPPNFTQLLRTCNRILDEHGRTKSKTSNPETLLRAFRGRLQSDEWTVVPLSMVLEVGEHAFTAPFRDQVDFDEVRRFFLAEIPVSDRPGFLGAMVRIYIESFDALAPHTQALARALKTVGERVGAQWQALLASFPSLFDPKKIVGEIADRMVVLEDVWQGLRDLGLRQPHAPGLMAAVHIEFLKRMGDRLSQVDEVKRVLAWLRPPGQSPMATGAAEAVTALLEPWSRQGAPADLKKLLMESLLDLYGHPKVSRNAIWNQVPQELEGLFLHWLSGASIRMLFSVLHEVERGHMWADREDFWWDLYEKGRIDEVWVAFNREGYRVAQSRLSSQQRQAGTAHMFGLQSGEKDKSLLVMRIGNKIVVEGTYNFKVHIFDARAQTAPKLYQRRYDVSDIRGRSSANAIPHLGQWQYKVMAGL